MPEYRVTIVRVDGAESTTTMKVEAIDQKEALVKVSFRVGVENIEDQIYTKNPWLGTGYSDGTTG